MPKSRADIYPRPYAADPQDVDIAQIIIVRRSTFTCKVEYISLFQALRFIGAREDVYENLLLYTGCATIVVLVGYFGAFVAGRQDGRGTGSSYAISAHGVAEPHS